MAICAQSIGVFCLFVVQTVLIICVSTPTAGTHHFPQHYTMIHWAGRIEKELEKVLQHVTGAQQMRSIYNEKKSQFEIKRNNPKDLVERVARDISKLLNSKSKALEKLVREAEQLQKEHVWKDGVTARPAASLTKPATTATRLVLLAAAMPAVLVTMGRSAPSFLPGLTAEPAPDRLDITDGKMLTVTTVAMVVQGLKSFGMKWCVK